jgi:hypothetical protein
MSPILWFAVGAFVLIAVGTATLQIWSEREFSKIQRESDKAWKKYGL